MGQLQIDVTPELENQLREEAERRGQALGEYLRELLAASVARAPRKEREPAWSGLPRRKPEDLDALAIAQGKPLRVQFKDLIGDFWPEDETCDEFIAAIRELRREGSRPRGRSRR